MSVLKRAYLYVTRKKVKSFIMLLILFGIATFAMSAMSMKKATMMNKKDIHQQRTNVVSLQSKSKLHSISHSTLQQILSETDVVKYHAVLDSEVLVEGVQKIESEPSSIQYQDPVLQGLTQARFSTSTQTDVLFQKGLLKLVEGRHITSDDKQKVLIHKALAQRNHLKIGDRITLQTNLLETKQQNTNKQVQVEIVGLFDSDIKGKNHNVDKVMNLLMGNVELVKELYDRTEEHLKYHSIDFYIKDTKSFVEEVKQLSIDWSDMNIKEEGIQDSVRSLDNIVNMMLIGIVVISIIILSLILIFWIQERTYEIGILLSIGIEKRKIIYQFVIELCMIAIFAFGLAYFSGTAFSKGVGTQLMEVVSRNSVEKEYGVYQNIEDILKKETLKSTDIQVTGEEVVYVWVMGMFIIIVSVTVSSILILRWKPKEILSNMS